METTPINQGQPWYDGDEKLLVEWFRRGESIEDIATGFGRSTTAIWCRLNALGYVEREKVMSKAPNRYLILGVRHGHVQRLASRRGSTPDEAITQALSAGRSDNQRLILIEIRDASDDVGAPLNTEVRIIEREKPVPPYRLVSLSRQEQC